MRAKRLLSFLDGAQSALEKLGKIAVALYRLAELVEKLHKIIGRL
jgi:hypothetical protein